MICVVGVYPCPSLVILEILSFWKQIFQRSLRGVGSTRRRPPFHYSIFGANSEAPKNLYIRSRLQKFRDVQLSQQKITGKLSRFSYWMNSVCYETSLKPIILVLWFTFCRHLPNQPNPSYTPKFLADKILTTFFAVSETQQNGQR